MSDSTLYRYPKERDQLVERLVAAERRNRVYEQALRTSLAGGERDVVTVLLARVEELEGIVSKHNERIARRNTA